MSKNKHKNRYHKRAKKKGFLAGMNDGLQTKGNLKNASLETATALIVGVVGGGVIGAIIGKPSFLAGIATTGAGYYSGSKLVQLIGVGMMAGGGIRSGTVSGLEGLDGVKERLQAFKTVLADKFYLDKIKKKASLANGIGELQYFTYPDGELAALNDIERQIEESAYQFQGAGLRGDDDDIQVGIMDLDDRLI